MCQIHFCRTTRSRLIFVFHAIIGGRSNVISTHFPINNQDSSKVLNMFELKAHFKKYMLAYEKY